MLLNNKSLYLKSTLFFLFFSLFSTSVYSQELPHVQGELLVHLDANTDLNKWTKDFNKRKPFEIQIKKRISPILDLYIVGFDFTVDNEEKLLLSLLRENSVYMAQYNHFVTLRAVPNDPQFDDQWQYINTGQDGGTPGADIDMELAWDLATGGITANGDTIVSCIIDDGIDGDHPDMAPNLFINYAEIPNNGIDDDNNGFIDDYRGWDTGSNTDAVYDGGGHGTPVAGIVGAKGNNEIGVAGVNWDVKLMIVQGGTGVESEVLEAYSYPLSFRRKYNETNGEEGAFVVSTNASWGINQGQPSDAPLWCAFYDTLGAEGIISCGATANANFDIDVVSDLPTGCSSEYLISVTNMNRNDVKVNSAGYGTETIDLGAFGAQTWTAAANGGYNSFGGTSGATPHVTGTIALLYSAPCTNIATLALENPAEAALIMRDAVFNGVDPNESLEGITVTGGRLNVNNTIQLLLATNCGDCPPPLVGSVEFLNQNSVNLAWALNDSINTTDLRWRAVGEMEWNIEESVTSPFLIETLDPCSEYEYQLKAFCNLDTTEFGVLTLFTSAGCCENPENVTANEVTIDASDIMWDMQEYAISYNVRYKPVSAADWLFASTADLQIQLSDLQNCTEYEVQLQSVCNLASPEYTESVFFFTQGCADACNQLPYCEVPGFDSDEEWIEQFSLGTFENETSDDSGYGDFTDIPGPELIKGGSYDMSLTPGYSGQSFDEVFLAWIDFNEDGIFDDATELVFSSGGNVTSTVSGTINIPSNLSATNTRMRIAMRFENDPSSCTDENFQDFGEVEDYCISFGCPTVQDIMIVDTSQENTAVLVIVGDDNADSQEYRYRKVGDTDWIEESSINLTISLEGLEKCTEYEVQARTNCGNSSSEYSGIVTFKTACGSNTTIDQANQSLKIQPNPFNSDFVINMTTVNSLTNCEIRIFDNVGQIVYSQSAIRFTEGENKIALNGDAFTAGMYIVQVRNNEVSLSQKVFKVD